MENKTQEEVILEKSLQEVLDTVGNSPIAEPEMFELLSATPMKKTKIVKLALEKSDLNQKDFKAIEVAKFFHQLSEKIISLKNKDGSFKSTSLTENCDLPDFEQAEEVQELWVKMFEAKDEKKREKVGDKLDALAWEISGLDKSKMSEWEEKLVVEQILQSGYDVTLTSLGKDLKNL